MGKSHVLFFFFFFFLFLLVPNQIRKSGSSLIQHSLIELTCHRTNQVLCISWYFLYPYHGWEVKESSSRSSGCLLGKLPLPLASQLLLPSAIIFTPWMKQRQENLSLSCYSELHIFKERDLFRWLYPFFSIHRPHLTLVYTGYFIVLNLCIFCALGEMRRCRHECFFLLVPDFFQADTTLHCHIFILLACN